MALLKQPTFNWKITLRLLLASVPRIILALEQEPKVTTNL